MLIYDALKKDHEVVKDLLSRLVNSADADAETRAQLISQIRDEIVPHARAEERVFYNVLRSIDVAKDMVGHGYAEHMEAEMLLRQLQAMEAVNADWHKTARKLQEALLHHIEEEEEKIIPAAQELLIEEEARMMAEAFEKLKPEIREGGFMSNTIDLIANLMPARFVAPFRSFTDRV